MNKKLFWFTDSLNGDSFVDLNEVVAAKTLAVGILVFLRYGATIEVWDVKEFRAAMRAMEKDIS